MPPPDTSKPPHPCRFPTAQVQGLTHPLDPRDQPRIDRIHPQDSASSIALCLSAGGELGLTWNGPENDPVVDFLDALLYADPAGAVKVAELLAVRPPDEDGVRRMAASDAIGYLEAVPGPTHAQAAHDEDEDARFLAVIECLIRAEQAATRRLVADLRMPSRASVGGMVERVLRADADRWLVLGWLEDRLAVHLLTGQLTEQAAASVIDRTLAALPPAPGKPQDGATRLRAAAVRTYCRTLSKAADEVRMFLTREWGQAVDDLARDGCPVGEVAWLGVARAWLSRVETAEHNA